MFEGVFQNILSSVGKHLNMTYSYGDARMGGHFDAKLPMKLGADAPPDSYHVSYPHFKMSLYWYLHVQQVPKWKSVIKAFQPSMWLLVSVSYMLALLIFWMFS